MRIPRQAGKPWDLVDVRRCVENAWRAAGMDEGQVAEASSHLLILVTRNGQVLLVWDDPNWELS